MIAVEINNCDLEIEFKPEIIYPGEYRVLGRCFPMERKIGSGQLATVRINGNSNNELTAECLTPNCPLRKKITDVTESGKRQALIEL